MKKAFALAIVALMICAMLISGCTAPEAGKKDGSTVLLNAIKNSKSITSSETSYDILISLGMIGINMKTSLWVKDEMMRTDLNGSMLGIPLVAGYYKNKDGSFSCLQQQKEWKCQVEKENVDLSGMARPLTMGLEEQEMMELITKGVLVIGSEVDESTIAGRKCDNVNIFINVSKLSGVYGSMNQSEFMRTAIQMKGSNSSDISVKECIDQTTGALLYFKLSTTAPSAFGTGMDDVNIEMTATKYSPNPSIPDEMFVLPAAATEAAAGN